MDGRLSRVGASRDGECESAGQPDPSSAGVDRQEKLDGELQQMSVP